MHAGPIHAVYRSHGWVSLYFSQALLLFRGSTTQWGQPVHSLVSRVLRGFCFSGLYPGYISLLLLLLLTPDILALLICIPLDISILFIYRAMGWGSGAGIDTRLHPGGRLAVYRSQAWPGNTVGNIQHTSQGNGGTCLNIASRHRSLHTGTPADPAHALRQVW